VLELVRAEVARREGLHREKGTVTRMHGVFEQKWWECPSSFAPRRTLRPTVAGKNKWARIDALQRAGEWLAEYYEALRRFVGGERDVVFPRGTWHMRVQLGCPVAAASS
jgi:putative transposase